MTIKKQGRVTVDPRIMVGKPVIKGTRITVESILRQIAAGWTMEQIIDAHPHLAPDDVYAAADYAADTIAAQAEVKQPIDLNSLREDYRDAILEIAEKHGASNVRVFGSVARGEAKPDSDVDVLVDFKADYTLWDHIGLKQDLEELLGRKVDVSIAKNLREELRPYIMQDVVTL